jgi:hypothetical protein
VSKPQILINISIKIANATGIKEASKERAVLICLLEILTNMQLTSRQKNYENPISLRLGVTSF